MCAGIEPDYSWPSITSVSPATATPGTGITIFGVNFTNPVTVITRQLCTDVVASSDGYIIAYLPEASAWNSFTDFFLIQETVIVIDSQNRTSFLENGIQIQLDFIPSVGRFFSSYPGWAAGIIIGIVVIIGLIVLCGYFCCCKDKKKDKRKEVDQKLKKIKINRH